MKEHERLEQLFEHIRNRDRPLIVEFAGTAEGGKGSLIKGVARVFRKAGFTVARPQEGPEIYRTVDRKTPVYNLLMGSHAMTNVIVGAHTKDYDVILLERALYDAQAFARFLYQRDIVSNLQREAVTGLLQLPELIQYIDFCFFVLCDPEQALERAAKDTSRLFSELENPWTNILAITELGNCYRQTFDAMCADDKPVALLDTTDMDKSDGIDVVVLKLAHVLSTRP